MGMKIQYAMWETTSFRTLIIGDGISTSITIDLEKMPVAASYGRISFGGNYPVDVILSSVDCYSTVGGSPDPTFTVKASLNKSKVILVFNKPLPKVDLTVSSSAGLAAISMQFYYEGE